MASVKQHYESVLADVYSWMYGGWDAALARNGEFFARHDVHPSGSRRAVDLGSGCGFQSIPLARRGFSVTAVDLDRKLLDELQAHINGVAVKIVQDDLLRFRDYVRDGVELIVCMVDTLVHLDSRQAVTALFSDVYCALETGGKFIATFRDLTVAAQDLDRFIPVRSDEHAIFTCFLEYEPETVKVHDLVYRRTGSMWQLHKSYYRKLRLAPRWVENELRQSGFEKIDVSIERGLATIIANK